MPMYPSICLLTLHLPPSPLFPAVPFLPPCGNNLIGKVSGGVYTWQVRGSWVFMCEPSQVRNASQAVPPGDTWYFWHQESFACVSTVCGVSWCTWPPLTTMCVRFVTLPCVLKPVICSQLCGLLLNVSVVAGSSLSMSSSVPRVVWIVLQPSLSLALGLGWLLRHRHLGPQP